MSFCRIFCNGPVEKATRNTIDENSVLDKRQTVTGMVDYLVQNVSYKGDLGCKIFCNHKF